MKKGILIISSCLMVFLPGTGFGIAIAGETGHYVSGIDEVFVGVPQPGFIYRLYNVFYTASEMTDQNGHDRNLDYDMNTYSLVNRLFWTPDIRFIGASYTADIAVPLIWRDVEIGKARIKDNESGLGDIYVEPMVLIWSASRYSAVFSLGMFLPTGQYDKANPASPGKDFHTYVIGLGSTWYFDTEKIWSFSFRSKYEIHGYKRDSDIRPGDDLHLESRISRTFSKIWDVGVIGYWHWQMSDDRGKDVVGDRSIHDRVYSIGPEIKLFLPPPVSLIFAFRNLWEYEAEDRSKGVLFSLTLTKTF